GGCAVRGWRVGGWGVRGGGGAGVAGARPVQVGVAVLVSDVEPGGVDVEDEQGFGDVAVVGGVDGAELVVVAAAVDEAFLVEGAAEGGDAVLPRLLGVGPVGGEGEVVDHGVHSRASMA